jgi:hypothetical protein
MKKQYSRFYCQCAENSDLGHPDDCMLVTDNNDDGCEIEQIVKRSRSNNDSDESLKQNYTTLIGVINLTCLDALFEEICNYLQMIKDDELLK